MAEEGNSQPQSEPQPQQPEPARPGPDESPFTAPPIQEIGKSADPPNVERRDG